MSMKQLGLIGGLSWESTRFYYEHINRQVQCKLGGLHSARILLSSIDFHPIAQLQSLHKWDEIEHILVEEVERLQHGGCDAIALCSNTIHKVFPALQQKTDIPMISIINSLAHTLVTQNITQIGLMGTKHLMQDSFYVDELLSYGKIDVVLPSLSDQNKIQDIIFSELCLGQCSTQSLQTIQQIIKTFSQQGIKHIVLGCTELGSVGLSTDQEIQIHDTSLIHAQALVDWMVN